MQSARAEQTGNYAPTDTTRVREPLSVLEGRMAQTSSPTVWHRQGSHAPPDTRRPSYAPVSRCAPTCASTSCRRRTSSGLVADQALFGHPRRDQGDLGERVCDRERRSSHANSAVDPSAVRQMLRSPISQRRIGASRWSARNSGSPSPSAWRDVDLLSPTPLPFRLTTGMSIRPSRQPRLRRGARGMPSPAPKALRPRSWRAR